VQSKYLSAAKRMDHLETDDENLWVKLTFKRAIILVCVVYFPPNSDEECFSRFYQKLEMAANSVKDRNIFIVGDFNLPSCKFSKSEHNYFLNFFELKQLNTVMNYNNRMLDLIYTNISPSKILVKKHDLPLVTEDLNHPTLYNIDISLQCSMFQNNDSDKIPINNDFRWKFTESKLPLLKKLISSSSWMKVYNCTNVDPAVEKFYEGMYELFDKCFLETESGLNAQYPKWFTPLLIRSIEKKYFLHKLWKGTDSKLAYAKFSEQRKLVKDLIKETYKGYIERSESQICNDPTQFWNFVSSKKDTTENFNEMTLDGDVFSDPQDISNAFSRYFSSVYNSTAPLLKLDLATSAPSMVQNCDITKISNGDIDFALKKLKPKRSAGPDHIPAYILKETGSELTNVLCFIFNLSIDSGSFPQVWKTSKVTPIFKKGDRTDVKNYRPVAVLSAPAKLLEVIIHRQIWNSVSCMIVDEQHGFRPARSTVTNLLCFNSYIERRLDCRSQVDAVYTDFEKAFDKVDHDILLLKLNNFGLSSRFVEFMASYLRNRQQYMFTINRVHRMDTRLSLECHRDPISAPFFSHCLSTTLAAQLKALIICCMQMI
jgi:hypothetical protein